MFLNVLFLALPVSASADLWSGKRWGIDIHYLETGERMPRGEIDSMEKAFTAARQGLQWNIVETTKGIYNFTIGEETLKDVPVSKVIPYWILCYGNPLYPDCQGLDGEECFAGFVHYAVATIHHFRNRGIIWELYNEPNGGWFWPKTTPSKYARMVNAVGAAIRGNASTKDEFLVGPAMWGFQYDWLSSVGASGALRWFDGISVHPYDTAEPELAIPKYAKLKQVVRQILPAEHQQPVFLQGEWGQVDGDSWVGAGRLARQKLVSDLAELVMDISYQDDMLSGNKPYAYFSAMALQRLLGKHRFVKRINTQDKDTYVLEYADPHSASATAAYAIWSVSPTLPVSAKRVGSGHRSVCPYPFTAPVSALQCNRSDVQQLHWMLGVPDATGRRQIRFDGDHCLDARDPSHLISIPCQANSASQIFIYHENGTITAPDTPNGDGKLGGCLNVIGKTGPSLHLTKCFSTPPHVDPNEGFIFNDMLGTFEDSGSDKQQGYPKRCMSSNIIKDGLMDCEGICIRTPTCRSFVNRSGGSCTLHAHPCPVPGFSPDCGSNCSGVAAFTLESIVPIPVLLESCRITYDMMGNATGSVCPKLGQTMQLSQDPQYLLPERDIVI